MTISLARGPCKLFLDYIHFIHKPSEDSVILHLSRLFEAHLNHDVNALKAAFQSITQDQREMITRYFLMDEIQPGLHEFIEVLKVFGWSLALKALVVAIQYILKPQTHSADIKARMLHRFAEHCLRNPDVPYGFAYQLALHEPLNNIKNSIVHEGI